MKDGGRAFPRSSNVNGATIQFGMSLRDYFAAKVMQGIMARDDETAYDGDDQSEEAVEAWRQKLRCADARYAYEMADSMLAERDKEQTNE